MSLGNAGTHRITVGDFEVTAINDTNFQGSTGLVAGVTPEQVEETLSANFRVLPPRLTVNAFLVRHGDRLTLIDTGGGVKLGPDNGNLVRRLATLGVAPADISSILVTHAHIDHISGLVDGAGAAVFPKAQVFLSGAEREFWLGDTKLPDAMADSVAIARSGLLPYVDRTTTVVDGGEAEPGIRLHAIPGHTPGHSGWVLSSGDHALLVWGDVVHLPGLQFTRPEAGMVFDTDVAQAQASRRRVFDLAATDKLLVAGMHLEFPTFGYVARASQGYAFVPVAWEP